MTAIDNDTRHDGLYSISALSEILDVPAERICTWIGAGLVKPNRRDGGECYFDFREISRAKTLADLTSTGLTLPRIRSSLEQLRKSLAPNEDPLNRLSAITSRGRLLIRANDGELSEVSGQINFDFYDDAEPILLHPDAQPRERSEWHERGVRCELASDLTGAIEAYMQALLIGGPQPQICFDLAHAYAQSGETERAVERYLQAIEINPAFADAWNNLGVLLAETGKRDEACVAFEGALVNNPADARARYNLADTLDELGRKVEAVEHWRTYLRHDNSSEHAAYARKRLA